MYIRVGATSLCETKKEKVGKKVGEHTKERGPREHITIRRLIINMKDEGNKPGNQPWREPQGEG